MQKITHERVKVLLLSHRIASFFIYDSFITYILHNLGNQKVYSRTVAASLSSVSSAILTPPLCMYCVHLKICNIHSRGRRGRRGYQRRAWLMKSSGSWFNKLIGCVGRCVTISVGILNENKKRKKKQPLKCIEWIYLTLQRKCTFYFFMFVLRK